MDTSTIIMMAGAVIMLIAAYWKAPEAAQRGLNATGSLILEITPRIIAAFTLAGLFQALVPGGRHRALDEARLRRPRPRDRHDPRQCHARRAHDALSPVIASLFKMGVGVGPLVAYLTAWSLLGLQRIIMWEIPFLGPKVVAVRVAVSFVFPLVAGWLCQLVWNKLNV